MNISADSHPLATAISTDAVSVSNLTLDFGRFQLGPLDLTVPTGYVTGLVGANGAGKTTLLKLLLQLQRPDSGTMTLLGSPVAEGSVAVREDLGVVFDAPIVLPEWTVRTAGQALSGFYTRWDASSFEALLERFGLSPRATVKSLSRGQGTKLMLALALAHQPRMLLLDEPTSGLDPASRRELLDLLAEYMAADESHTILFSTHITSDLDRIADHLRVLSNGRLVESGSLHEVTERYAVVRGPRRTLTTHQRELIHGMQERADLYSGLVATTATASFGSEVVFDPASVEDIVVYLSATDKKVAA